MNPGSYKERKKRKLVREVETGGSRTKSVGRYLINKTIMKVENGHFTFANCIF